MSITTFVTSAELLYKEKHYNEALCLACIAVDACSKRIYCNKNVSERYKLFLREHFKTICQFGFPGILASRMRIKVNCVISNLKLDNDGYADMIEIIYHVLRCGLVHECDVEKSIVFTEATEIGDWNTDKFYIPQKIILGLIEAIKETI